MKTKCPHCDHDAYIRSSVQVSPTVREGKAICDDPECGYTFVIQLAAIRSLSPSSKPRPGLNIPYSHQAWHALQQNAQMSIFDKSPAT